MLIYSPKEVAGILAHTGKSLLPAMLLVTFAGVRLAEAQRLTWADVDLERRWVTVSLGKAKTRARRVCPVADNLAEWLAPLVGPPQQRIYKESITIFCRGQAGRSIGQG